MKNKKEIKEILKWLPTVRQIIKLGGKWEQLKGICEPPGLTDTAFRENPTLNDYLVSEDYWKKLIN